MNPFDSIVRSQRGPWLVAAEPTVVSGHRLVALFSLASGGAALETDEAVPEGDVAGILADLQAQGVIIGHCDSFCPFIWATLPNGFAVWDSEETLLVTDGEHLIPSRRPPLARSSLKCVVAYASEDQCERGVRAELHESGVVTLVDLFAFSDTLNEPQGRDALRLETEWAVTIAALVAAWAQIPSRNLI